MIFGVGCDIEDISRFENRDEAFLKTIYTPKEQEYCLSKAKPAQHLAARFCGKESVVKALYAIGIKDVYYKDIEILRDANGAPFVTILKESAKDLSIQISLSHCKDKAMANVMIIKKAS